mmetsp:Transcript_35538/g.75922  ORF Transcript_35538/g.75922 Transcript_35538/m.75922 type:complete len:93 (-) Transcript_35538:514-792(-)
MSKAELGTTIFKRAYTIAYTHSWPRLRGCLSRDAPRTPPLGRFSAARHASVERSVRQHALTPLKVLRRAGELEGDGSGDSRSDSLGESIPPS